MRQAIWKFASQHPRKIKLFAEKFIPRDTSCVLGQSKIPSILHTSKESREEALRAYILVYEKTALRRSFEKIRILNGRQRLVPTILPVLGNLFYINFAVDIFQHPTARHSTDLQRFSQIDDFNFQIADLQKIQHLEIVCPRIQSTLRGWVNVDRWAFRAMKIATVSLGLKDVMVMYSNWLDEGSREMLQQIATQEMERLGVKAVVGLEWFG